MNTFRFTKKAFGIVSLTAFFLAAVYFSKLTGNATADTSIFDSSGLTLILFGATFEIFWFILRKN
jgi:hypothetical protein